MLTGEEEMLGEPSQWEHKHIEYLKKIRQKLTEL